MEMETLCFATSSNEMDLQSGEASLRCCTIAFNEAHQKPVPLWDVFTCNSWTCCRGLNAYNRHHVGSKSHPHVLTISVSHALPLQNARLARDTSELKLAHIAWGTWSFPWVSFFGGQLWMSSDPAYAPRANVHRTVALKDVILLRYTCPLRCYLNMFSHFVDQTFIHVQTH